VNFHDRMVLAVVLTALVVWVAGAAALALLTGGMIHERDEHDRPFGGGRYSERAARGRAVGLAPRG
jgi:hypothetical protein